MPDPLEELAAAAAALGPPRRPPPKPRRPLIKTHHDVRLIRRLLIALAVLIQLGLGLAWFHIEDIRTFLGIEPRVVVIDGR